MKSGIIIIGLLFAGTVYADSHFDCRKLQLEMEWFYELSLTKYSQYTSAQQELVRLVGESISAKKNTSSSSQDQVMQYVMDKMTDLHIQHFNAEKMWRRATKKFYWCMRARNI